MNDLGDLPPSDDVVLQLEQFKMSLMARATGSDIDAGEYIQSRKLLLGLPKIENSIPRFIRLCRTPDEFWQWIKGEADNYADRRTIISEGLNPVLEIIEYDSAEGSLEFQKNYEQKEVIGSGGFGLVYLYEHKLLKLPFAVKMFAPAFYEGGGKELERFFQESRMLFELFHPSIIKVYDAGMIGQRPFIRMEYFNGKNLNEILDKSGIISLEKALTMMKSLVSAMRHAHEDVGIVHRDLKPSNIMAAKPDQFRVIDFGLGIFIENELHSRLTKTGEAAAGGYYTAPELVKDPYLIDKRSDIYSLGAIWYSMIVGQPPAGSNIIELLKQVKGIDSAYVECISRCLANLDSRTVSCAVLLEEMGKLKL